MAQAFLFIEKALGNHGYMHHGKKNDPQEKEVALEWIYKSWSKLKRFYPNIHLAQLHNHLNSHEEEITLAFGNRIQELKTLKNIFDPQGILPPL